MRGYGGMYAPIFSRSWAFPGPIPAETVIPAVAQLRPEVELMARDRGWYAATYAAQIDSPEWVRLSLHAASVWWALKNCRDNNRAGIFPIFREMVACRSKVPMEHVQDALRELQDTGWIVLEGEYPGMTWVWLRNHLRYDPTFSPGNANHVTGLVSDIEGLPHIQLVASFVEYYKELNYLPAGFEWKVESHANGIPNPSPIPSVPYQTIPDHTKTNTKGRAKSQKQVNTPEGLAAIDAYNHTFGTGLKNTAGNLTAAARAYEADYTIEQLMSVFLAVREGSTPTALWCQQNNHQFEYLIRPPYRHHKSGETVMGPLDKILNELSVVHSPKKPMGVPIQLTPEYKAEEKASEAKRLEFVAKLRADREQKHA